MPMNPELKQKWVDALRSGEYKQSPGQLYNSANDTYCCLGVLCDVTGIEKAVAHGYLCYEVQDGTQFVPDIIKVMIPLAVQSELAAMNDARNKSFPEIATYIEENL